MNQLYVGFTKIVDLPKGGFLLIDDEVPKLPQWRRARTFDPAKHSFNPLKNIGYKKARQIADLFYTISPQGENTLTVRNGRRALLELLLSGVERLDEIDAPRKSEPGIVDAVDAVKDVLMSPVLRRVLCGTPNFTFKENSINLAKINRAELGEFDALVLGLFLIAEFPGQVVVPDFGFYGRDGHTHLIRENRLIAGVNTLREFPPKLRQAMLLIEDKIASGVTFDDAEELASYERLVRATNGYNDFVQQAMA
jgi:hypothetical protein